MVRPSPSFLARRRPASNLRRFLRIIGVFILAFVTGFVVLVPFLFLSNLFQNEGVNMIMSIIPLSFVLAWQRIYLASAVDVIKK